MNCGSGEQYLALYAIKNALSENKQDRYGRSEYDKLGIYKICAMWHPPS
jgi:hypothetical protein